MPDLKITVAPNGPLKVEGDLKLVDHEGNELPAKEGMPVFLCRCGASQNKPFCDGSHNRIDFQAG
ncbi:MAG: CDGSH iron-sulfur domain-containing protein [Gemmatimonadota bacterium]